MDGAHWTRLDIDHGEQSNSLIDINLMKTGGKYNEFVDYSCVRVIHNTDGIHVPRYF